MLGPGQSAATVGSRTCRANRPGLMNGMRRLEPESLHQLPRLVDWTSPVRAPAAYDLEFSHIILAEFAPEVADDPERPRAVNAALQSECAQLAGMSPAALTAAIESYLPIVRVLFLLGGAFPAHRERLMQRVEAALRAED
jgi:hypothetical protein